MSVFESTASDRPAGAAPVVITSPTAPCALAMQSAISAQRRQRILPIAVWTLVALGLTGVATLYLQPDFIVAIANRLWTCF